MSYNSENNVLTPDEKNKLNELWNKTEYPPLNHMNTSYNLWTIATWNQDDVPQFENPKVRDLEKIWLEIANTDRNTTVLPIQFQDNLPNILTNDGMTNMGQLSTAESVLTNTHIAVGDVNTTELVTNTALGNELDRKVWSEKVVVNQTEKYAGSFVRSDFGQDVTLKEAGGFTASSGVILVFRVTFADKSITTGQIITLQISVQHQNGVVI